MLAERGWLSCETASNHGQGIAKPSDETGPALMRFGESDIGLPDHVQCISPELRIQCFIL